MWYAIIIFLIIIWIIIGQGSSPSGTVGTGNQDCSSCEKDREWWNSLNKFQKAKNLAYWSARYIACRAKGCL